MEYNFFDKIKELSLKYKAFIVPILSLVIIITFVYFYSISYSKYINYDSFNEIDEFIRITKEKDANIYNPYKTKIINQESRGIDISEWQGEIDWDWLKDSVDFVIIRCGGRTTVEGKIFEDNNFRKNIEEATKRNIPVGVYFFSAAKNEKEVYEEASFTLNLIKNYKITYPVVYDYETVNEAQRTDGLSKREITHHAKTFLTYINNHGYDVMAYINQYDYDYSYNINDLQGIKIWYAYYGENLRVNNYDMLQYTSTGRVNGIRGNVDMNISRFSYVLEGEQNG